MEHRRAAAGGAASERPCDGAKAAPGDTNSSEVAAARPRLLVNIVKPFCARLWSV